MTRNQIVVKAPLARVFDYVSDLTKHGEWSTHELDIEAVEPGERGVGSQFRSHGAQFGRPVEDMLTVTELVPGQRFAFESKGPQGEWSHVYQFAEEEGGVSVTRTMRSAQSSLLMRLAGPLVDFGLKRRQNKGLELLKRRLEA